MFDEYLKFAQSLGRKGGSLLRDSFGKVEKSDVESKGARDIVTKLDKEVEDLYAKEINVAFPDHGIIGEEGTSEGEKREWVWVLDPLDGTKNYSSHVPFFCTSICLMQNQEPVMTVIYEPITDLMYTATKDGGAFVNGEPIHVSKTDELSDSMVMYCHSYEKEDIEALPKYLVDLKLATRDAARLRSAGSEMALVAKGTFEAYTIQNMPIWDLTAGALLVREAGGKVTNLSGEPWAAGDTSIMVSNGTKVHEEMLRILNS